MIDKFKIHPKTVNLDKDDETGLTKKERGIYDLIRLNVNFVFVRGCYHELKNRTINGLPLEAILYDAHQGIHLSLVQIFDFYTRGNLHGEYDITTPVSDFVLKRLNKLISYNLKPPELLNPLGGKPRKTLSPLFKQSRALLHEDVKAVKDKKFDRFFSSEVIDLRNNPSENKILDKFSGKSSMYKVSKQQLNKDYKDLENRAARINEVNELLKIFYIKNPDNDKDIQMRKDIAHEKLDCIYEAEKKSLYL